MPSEVEPQVSLDGQQEMLRTNQGEFPLDEYRLPVGEREWSVLHTGLVLTHADEVRFFKEVMERLPYGVALWPASIALAQEVASRAEAFAGKRVLELGAGTGLPGLIAAAVDARVVQTDRNELALHVCRRNGERNGIQGVEYRQVDWTAWEDAERYDWILGSDILYAESLHPQLRRIFETNLAVGGRVLLSDPFRTSSWPLFQALEADGWEVAVARWNLGAEQARKVGVFELAPPAVAGEGH